MSITVTPAIRWQDPQAPITVEKLDLTGTPTATVDPNSVGIPDLNEDDVTTIVASNVGLDAIYTAPGNITCAANATTTVTSSLAVPGAVAGQIVLPEQVHATLVLTGVVSASDVVTLYARNPTTGGKTITTGTVIHVRVI